MTSSVILAPLFLLVSLSSTVSAYSVEGSWTYSPSFEAMSGIKGLKNIGSHETNLFMIPERNSFKICNETIYQCKMCDYRGIDPDQYVQHQKEKHFFPGHEAEHKWVHDLAKRQDFNYSCNVCNETYKTEMALLWHMTKYEHISNDHDNELCKYLRARIQLNTTYGRKIVYHPLARPFYPLTEPPDCSEANSTVVNQHIAGFRKATYIPEVDLSSGDISNQALNDDVIKTGISKYQKEDVAKRFKKVNGVNVYQKSPEELEYQFTDETAEQARQASAQARRQARKDAKRAYAEQDSEELAAKEMKEEAESEHSASYYRRQLDEYGPFASHSDKVGDRKLKKKTKKVRVTKPHIYQKVDYGD